MTDHIETIEAYDYRYGLPTRSVDRNGTITETIYDGFGRVLSLIRTDSGGEQLSREGYSYNDTSTSGIWHFPYRIIHKVYDLEDGTISDTTRFDGMGRKIISSQSWWGSLPRTQRYYYDKMGRLSTLKGPYLGHDNFTADVPEVTAVAITEYDAFDRPIKVTTRTESGHPAVTEYKYDGFLTTITDPDQVKRVETMDGFGHIIKIWELGSKEDDVEDIVTHYTYNVAGDLTEVVKTNLYGDTNFCENETRPVKWTMAYDTVGRKRRMEDPDMGVWTYTYYKDGQLASQTDEKGQTVGFSYDELGRLSEKSYSGGTPSVQYRYDRAANGIGRLYTATSDGGDVLRGVDAYDGLGRERVTRTVITGDKPRLTEYAYNQAGLLKRIKYPSSDGYAITYDYYSNSGLIRSVSDDDGVLAEFDGYPALGGLENISFGNGVETVQQYSPYSGRLGSIRTTAADLPIVDKAYTYTAAGDISTLTDSGVTYTYTYDSLHRLTSETEDAGSIPVLAWVIDFFYDDAGPLHAPSEITLNGQSRMVGYDENGNTTSLADMTNPNAVAERTISYNDDNMPVSVTHAIKGTTSFLYDGDGRRVKKSDSRGSTYYINDLFEVKDGLETSYVFANGLRIAQVTAKGKKFLHADHLGSTVSVTDEAGTKLEEKSYLPYGLSKGAEDIGEVAYQFTDQEHDGSTGLYNYDARLYDPVIGRFLSPDSIIPEPLNPQSLDRFNYCLNNPLRYVDPSGHFAGPGDHEAAEAAGKDFYEGYGDTWGNGETSGNSDTGDDWSPSYMVEIKSKTVELFGYKIGTHATATITINGIAFDVGLFPGAWVEGDFSVVRDKSGNSFLLSGGILNEIELTIGEIPIGGPKNLIKLTKGGLRKIGNLRKLKDTTAADAIRSRGGGAGQVNQLTTDLRSSTVGEIANRAARGDRAAETAMKIIKQAGKKAQKYGGK